MFYIDAKKNAGTVCKAVTLQYRVVLTRLWVTILMESPSRQTRTYDQAVTMYKGIPHVCWQQPVAGRDNAAGRYLS